MSYADGPDAGFFIAQHFGDLSAPIDGRYVKRMARVYGRDPTTFNLIYADGVNYPNEPNSIGPWSSSAVWYSSGNPEPAAPASGGGMTVARGQPRNTPLWADAWPGVVVAAPKEGDAYNSSVVSSTWVLPAYSQDPTDPTSWVADSGLLPQKVCVPGGGPPAPSQPAPPPFNPAMPVPTTFSPPPATPTTSQSLPVGTPVIVLPFSVTTEQQMAAVPASTQLVAVWRGGAAEGPLGTLVYDVTPAGALDYLRRARDQSSWRVYRLPDSGPLPFGAAPSPSPLQQGFNVKNPQVPGPSTPISSGLAWQCGYDVDGQAGLGVIVDQVSTATTTPSGGAITPTITGGYSYGALSDLPGLPTTYGGVPPGTTTASQAPTTGQATGTTPTTQEKGGGVPQTAGTAPVFGVSSARAYGPLSVGQYKDKHRISLTPDGEPVNCTHWNVLDPIDGDGYDAPAETAGLYRPTSTGGPLVVPVFWRYDSGSSHPYVTGPQPGLRRWQSTSWFDAPSVFKNTLDKAAADKQPQSDKDPTTDGTKTGDATKPSGDQTKPPYADAKPYYADGAKTGDATKDPSGDSHFTKPPQYEPALKPATDGHYQKPTRDPGGLKFIEAEDPAGPSDGPAGTSGVFTFGGQVLLAGGNVQVLGGDNPATDGPISVNRSYGRTPAEIAGPGILGRSPRVFGPDVRGRVAGLTDEQMQVYDGPAPITGQLAAVADQGTGSFVWFPGSEPGTSLYVGGAANSGGFAMTPSTVDAVELQGSGRQANPEELPTTTFFANTFASQIAWGDVHLSGVPKDGYDTGRGSNTTWSLDWCDSEGRQGEGGVGALPSALFFDSGQNPVDPPPACQIWGGQVVTVFNTTNGQAPAGTFFQADGTNTAPGGTWVNPSSVSDVPSGYVNGLDVSWTGALTIGVSAGTCRDTTNTAAITLAAPVSTLPLNSSALLGNDAIDANVASGITATVSNAGSEASLSLAVLTASPLSLLPSRLVGVAVDISAPDANSVSTMTPHTPGTSVFTQELAVGDVVGNGVIGWSSVLAVDNDSSVKLLNDQTEWGGSGSHLNQTAIIYENLTLQAGATPSKRVASMKPDGTQMETFGKLNGGANASGLDPTFGQPNAIWADTWTDASARTYLPSAWVQLWARATTGGTSTVGWSTQRTTPYTPAAFSGYSLWRCVASLPVGTDNNVPPFDWTDLGSSRLMQYEIAKTGGTVPIQVLGGASATAWTELALQQSVSPLATLALLNVSLANPAVNNALYARRSGFGTTALTRPKALICEAGGEHSAAWPVATDDAQNIDWVLSAADANNPALVHTAGYYFTP